MNALIDGFCEPFRMLRRWFGPKPKRIALKLVHYDNANAYLERGWRIAKEEDNNRKLGFVWLERLEDSAAGGQS